MTHDVLRALRVVEFQAEDDAVLANAHEPVGILRLDSAQALAHTVGDVVHHRPGLGARADLQRLDGSDAAELRSAECRDVTEAVLGEPAGAFFTCKDARDGIHAAGDPLARDHDVRLNPGLGDAPELARAHEAGLHLVGDIEGVVLLAQFLDRVEVSGVGKRESVGRGDRLHDDRRDVATPQGVLHRVEVVEGDVREVLGLIGEEELGEAVVTGADCQAGVTVVSLEDRDDLALLRGVAGCLERDVDGLAATGAVHHLGQACGS